MIVPGHPGSLVDTKIVLPFALS